MAKSTKAERKGISMYKNKELPIITISYQKLPQKSTLKIPKSTIKIQKSKRSVKKYQILHRSSKKYKQAQKKQKFSKFDNKHHSPVFSQTAINMKCATKNTNMVPQPLY